MDAEPEQAGAAGVLRRLLGGAPGALWLAVALVGGWLLWPSSLGGCTTLTIVSGQSMEPTYSTGDLVVARCGPVETGDVIVYNPPNVGGARVIHRVVDGDAQAGWAVRGDNNDFLDPWLPTSEDVLGSAVLHLPQVGRFASILLSPLTWISLLLVALAMVLWPGRDEDPDDDPDEHDPGGAPGLERPPAAVPAVAGIRGGDLFDGVGTRTREAARLPARLLRRVAVAVVIVVPLGAAAGVAHAADLALDPVTLGTHGGEQRCTTEAIAFAATRDESGAAAGVSVAYPEACAGTSGSFRLIGSSGALTADVPLALPAGTATSVALSTYAPGDVTVVALVLDGWGMATGWSFTPPPLPAPGDVVTNVDPRVVLVLGPWTEVEGRQCVPVDLQHAKEGNRAWVLDVDVTAFPFDGTVPTFGGAHGAWVLTAPSPTAGWIRLTGQPPYDQVHQVHQSEISFTICS